MDPIAEQLQIISRRQFLKNSGLGFGATALGTMLNPSLFNGTANAGVRSHFSQRIAPKAKRIIYLFMAGGPSHIDTFDFHPEIRGLHGTELPDSIRQGQRITGMTSNQSSFPVVAPMFDFKRHGKHGTWVSELLPYTASIVDDITIIKSMHTEAVNHDPAITFINTGQQAPGKPSMGAWLNYGLGSENDNMPGYVVMISRGNGNPQALYSRLWGSGFLPAEHQGVMLRSSGDPVLYLTNPSGVSRTDRRMMLDGLSALNEKHYDEYGDPETQARIAQYEMAYRMQTEAPEILNSTNEPESTFQLYGDDAKKPGTFAANCLRARRLAEKGVRFIQLYHRGWDQHGNLPKDIRGQCRDIDQGAAGLIKDLKQRGMLDDTLVVWGGEFGRTIYSQGKLTKDNHGRDHHGRCFTVWMAGGGVKGGFELGMTDTHSYNILESPKHIRDLNATMLHSLGVDHEQLTFPYQGLDQRLTGVEPAHVMSEIFS
ncbi:MAG: hypothetical protein ACI9X0_002221 [Kiritimatiellia bacterium]|jgi:hypothetical protein